MKTVKAVLNLEQAAQAITLISKKITKLKAIGFAFIGGAGILIGAALNNFEDAGQLEAMNEENKRVYEAEKRKKIEQTESEE